MLASVEVQIYARVADTITRLAYPNLALNRVPIGDGGRVVYWHVEHPHIISVLFKLPAVALGRTDFGFREAWNVSEGNFWPLAAVFALNAAAVLVSALVLLTIIAAFERIAPLGGAILGIALMAIFQLFYTVFNASIFTSLYGFFVERRDF